jgi:hypothetical protein
MTDEDQPDAEELLRQFFAQRRGSQAQIKRVPPADVKPFLKENSKKLVCLIIADDQPKILGAVDSLAAPFEAITKEKSRCLVICTPVGKDTSELPVAFEPPLAFVFFLDEKKVKVFPPEASREAMTFLEENEPIDPYGGEARTLGSGDAPVDFDEYLKSKRVEKPAAPPEPKKSAKPPPDPRIIQLRQELSSTGYAREDIATAIAAGKTDLRSASDYIEAIIASRGPLSAEEQSLYDELADIFPDRTNQLKYAVKTVRPLDTATVMDMMERQQDEVDTADTEPKRVFSLASELAMEDRNIKKMKDERLKDLIWKEELRKKIKTQHDTKPPPPAKVVAPVKPPETVASPTRGEGDAKIGVVINGKRAAIIVKRDLTLLGLFAKLKEDGKLAQEAEVAGVTLKPASAIPADQFGKTIDELRIADRLIELTLA